MAKIIEILNKWFGGGPVYLRFDEQNIYLLEAGSGQELTDQPLVAVSRAKPRAILGVGREAVARVREQGDEFELINPFDHPRLVLQAFDTAEKMLHYFLLKLQPKSAIVRPLLVLHPARQLAGGLSDIEQRALTELGAGVGARKVYLWTGRALNLQDLRRGIFQNSKE